MLILINTEQSGPIQALETTPAWQRTCQCISWELVSQSSGASRQANHASITTYLCNLHLSKHERVGRLAALSIYKLPFGSRLRSCLSRQGEVWDVIHPLLGNPLWGGRYFGHLGALEQDVWNGWRHLHSVPRGHCCRHLPIALRPRLSDPLWRCRDLGHLGALEQDCWNGCCRHRWQRLPNYLQPVKARLSTLPPCRG